ncbi:carbohydrate sulfotransferase 10-like [Tubulanus polymorphus]|uniref:carbohydrate sulfotransferase 10-like n=1 Tax=Tubulanus polymorphus TaxID=672921 RepID=UPI003DA3FB9A
MIRKVVATAISVTLMLKILSLFKDTSDVAVKIEIPQDRTISPSVGDLRTIYQQRLAHVKAGCEKLPSDNSTDSHTYNSFTVDDVHKILYCEIPKVGTSIWRYTLLHTTGKLLTTNLSVINNFAIKKKIYVRSLSLIRSLSSYSREETAKRLKSYFKFMFVRHPFERLLSAYLDKVVKKHDRNYANLETIILQSARNDVKPGDRATFKEFAEFILRRSHDDIHWAIYNKLCRPCEVQYSFIGKYGDTVHDDFKLVQSRFQLEPELAKTATLPHTYSIEKLHKYYKDLPKELIDKLYAKYRADFILFDYDLDFLRNQ